MRERKVLKKSVVFFLAFIFLSSSLTMVISSNQISISTKDLPAAKSVDMIVETSMFRRMSVREFTDEPVNETDLATVLWAAYGLRTDGTHTVAAINQTHAAVLYVFTTEAVYTYNPELHSLEVYLEGDHRSEIDLLQYDAPVQLGLCWNTSLADPNQAGMELGAIGQNIQFMANALGLGTVVTGQIPPAIKPVGLPADEQGMIIMPLGHPVNEYDFVKRPLWISPMPLVKESTMNLSTALQELSEHDDFSKPLTDQEFSQVIWSTYGFSPLVDKSSQEPVDLKRHRSVPSAHGYYPLDIYVASADGIYQYYPNVLIEVLSLISAPVDRIGFPVVSFMKKVSDEDIRNDLSLSCEHNAVSSASTVIIPVLNLNKAKELSVDSAQRFWYYEAGAVAQNVLLEAASWDLSTQIIYPVDTREIRLLLNLNEDMIPQVLLPVGS